jgi:hypothetical protein
MTTSGSKWDPRALTLHGNLAYLEATILVTKKRANRRNDLQGSETQGVGIKQYRRGFVQERVAEEA